MYLVNDINCLLTLVRSCKVHEKLPAGSLSLSRMKIQEYGGTTRQQLSGYPQINHLNIDDAEQYDSWCVGKRSQLSHGDLSTIYIAVKDPQLTILLSEEDFLMPAMCSGVGVRYEYWEALLNQIADERIIAYYEMIKKAS